MTAIELKTVANKKSKESDKGTPKRKRVGATVAEGSAPIKKRKLQKEKSGDGKPFRKFKPGEAGGKPGTGKKVKAGKKDGKVVRKWKPGGKDSKPGSKWKPRSKANEEPKKRPKETAQSRKERKLKRKQRNPNYELSVKAKKIWEKLRIQKGELSKKEKSELVETLMRTVKEQNKKLIDLCFAHDTCRVVQTCIKQGVREQRQRIFQELKHEIVVMCKNKYARNIVWKMLKYGIPDERDYIMRSFKRHVYRLMRLTKSSDVIEYAYNHYATAEQRDFLVKQLYGRVFRNCENSDSSTFSEMLVAQPEMKESLLTSFKCTLEAFAERVSLKHTMVHKAIHDFFENCDHNALRAELIESLRESLIHMMHTRDGAHVTMECLWHGSKKDRKVIVKTMKEFVIKLCCEEFGHLTILATFDCVDDTVLVKKALVQPIMQNIDELIANKYGRKVLLYLIVNRDSSHFVPAIVNVLRGGDENKSSKKPMEQRRRELAEGASAAMVDFVAEHIDELIFDRSRFLFVDAAYLHCTGDKTAISEALMDFLNKPYEPERKDEQGKMHIVEDPCGHMIIKRIIKGEYEANENHSFAHSILDEISLDTMISWTACNRGTQILLALVESNDKDVSTKAKTILKKKLRYLKKKSSFKSSQILIEKLE